MELFSQQTGVIDKIDRDLTLGVGRQSTSDRYTYNAVFARATGCRYSKFSGRRPASGHPTPPASAAHTSRPVAPSRPLPRCRPHPRRFNPGLQARQAAVGAFSLLPPALDDQPTILPT